MIPPKKNFYSYCGLDFPRGPLAIIPFDMVFSHEERWEYPNPNKDAGQPKYLKSPPGKLTMRYYCAKKDCILKRFPYFNKEILKISAGLELRAGHKALLKDQSNADI